MEKNGRMKERLYAISWLLSQHKQMKDEYVMSISDIVNRYRKVRDRLLNIQL